VAVFWCTDTNHVWYRQWNKRCAKSQTDGCVRKREDVDTANREVCLHPILPRLGLRTAQVRTSSWHNKKHK
jgi:hypothetical protein